MKLKSVFTITIKNRQKTINTFSYGILIYIRHIFNMIKVYHKDKRKKGK
jgi:hypothetical protein